MIIKSFEPDRARLESKIVKMPKVELHVHLEGASKAETIWDLAKKNRVQLPAQNLKEWKSLYAFRDFNHFIEIYEWACRCIRTPEDYALLGRLNGYTQKELGTGSDVWKMEAWLTTFDENKSRSRSVQFPITALES